MGELTKSEIGRKSRRSGKAFENEVRRDLEKRGYTVCKWTNIVDITEDKIIPAKSKFNPFTKRTMSEGSGFPDFVAFKIIFKNTTKEGPTQYFKVMGVESKKSKYLDAKEKRMCRWYNDHNTFSKIYVAYPLKNKLSDKKKKGIAYYIVDDTKLK